MTASPDDIAELVAHVYEVAGALRAAGEREAATAGQTQSRWQMMSVLSEGDWTVPRAAKRLGITRQSAQRTVNALFGAGLAEPHDNPFHARSQLVKLTPRGHEVLSQISHVADQWHAAVATALSEAAVRTTRETLETLRAASVDRL